MNSIFSELYGNDMAIEKFATGNDKANSAYQLASVALDKSAYCSAAAASLLLSLEDGKSFNLQDMIHFDTANRSHADSLIISCAAFDYWPSKWLIEAGLDGEEIMKNLRATWP
jgi:hypothetical protein